MYGRTVCGLLILGLLFASGASASPLLGSFAISGDVSIPAAMLATEGKLGIMLPADESLLDLRVNMTRADVTRHEWRAHDVALGDRHVTHVMDHQRASYALTDVDLRLAETSSTGLVFLEGRSLSLAFDSRTDVAGGHDARFGDASTSTSDQPDARRPSLAFDGPTLAFGGAGVTVVGDFTLYLFGPDVWIDASQNSTRVETGSSADADNLAQRLDRALVLRGEGTLVLSGSYEARTEVLRGTLEGVIEADKARGTLRNDDGTYSGDNESLLISGWFDTTLRASMRDQVDLVVLGGELTATNMAKTAVAAPAAGWGLTWGSSWLILAAAVLGVAAWGAGSRWRGGQDAERLVRQAEEALEGDNMLQARSLLEQAATLAPSSARVRFDLAYVRWRTGEEQAALALLADLDATEEAADARLLRARILVSQGRRDEAAETLARMLDEAPVMLLELDDPAFVGLAYYESLRKAVAKARRDMGG